MEIGFVYRAPCDLCKCCYYADFDITDDMKSEFCPPCLLRDLFGTVEVPTNDGADWTSVVSDFDWSSSFVSS